EEIAKAGRLYEEMLQTTDVTRWTELNLQFHEVLCTTREHSRLAYMVRTLRDWSAPYIALSLYMKPEHIAASNIEHAQILSLYQRRNVKGVVKQTVAHLKATLKVILLAIKSNGEK